MPTHLSIAHQISKSLSYHLSLVLVPLVSTLVLTLMRSINLKIDTLTFQSLLHTCLSHLSVLIHSKPSSNKDQWSWEKYGESSMRMKMFWRIKTRGWTQKWFWKSMYSSGERKWMMLLWNQGEGTEAVVTVWQRNKPFSITGGIWKGITSNNEVLREMT